MNKYKSPLYKLYIDFESNKMEGQEVIDYLTKIVVFF